MTEQCPPTIDVNGTVYVRQDQTEAPPDHKGRKYVIVRCRDAGVHAGYLVSVGGRTVELMNTRRLWQWHAAKGHTLSALSVHGLKDEADLKIPRETLGITLLDACEIIPCTATARNSIREWPVHGE